MNIGDKRNSVACTIHHICTNQAGLPRNPSGVLKFRRSCTWLDTHSPFQFDPEASTSKSEDGLAFCHTCSAHWASAASPSRPPRLPCATGDYHAPSVNSYVAAVEAPDGVANQVWLGWRRLSRWHPLASRPQRLRF